MQAQYSINNLIGKSLVDIIPYLCKEWDYVKNEPLLPEMVTKGSNKKIWWKCSKGHEWKAIIASRSTGVGCPYCHGQLSIQEETDLGTNNTKLTEEWNFEKNYPLLPYSVTKNSGKKVWWKCSKNHEWQATVNSRTHGNGCPYCSGRLAVVGETDLATTNPSIITEWNYSKNNGLTPQMVSKGSSKKVWWLCPNGHEYEQKIFNRACKNTSCPICSGRKKLEHGN